MAAHESRTEEGGREHMRLMTRMMAALAVTVFAALVLYFVFLNGDRSAHNEVQPTDHHIGYSLTSDADSVRYLVRVSE